MKRIWSGLWWLVWYPLDCLDKDGKPDHGKIAATFVGVILARMVWMLPPGTLPSWTLALVFIVGLFGPRMMYRFIASKFSNPA